MGKNVHPTYYFKIKKDLTFEKVEKQNIRASDADILYIIETQFSKIMGGNYTYSTHTIRNSEMIPTPLQIGNVTTDNYCFSEYCIESHHASIIVNIIDCLGIKKEQVFHHSNGLGNYYSDIDGQGILSFIKILKVMERIEKFGNWEKHDMMIDLKIRIGAKLYHNSFELTEILDFIEEDEDIYWVMVDKYHKGYFNSIGLDFRKRKSNP